MKTFHIRQTKRAEYAYGERKVHHYIRVESTAGLSFVMLNSPRPKIINFIKDREFLNAHKEFLSLIKAKGREHTFYFSTSISKNLIIASLSTIKSSFLLWLIGELAVKNPAFLTLYKALQEENQYFSIDFQLRKFLKIYKRRNFLPPFSVEEIVKDKHKWLVIKSPPDWYLVKQSEYFSYCWRLFAVTFGKHAPIFPHLQQITDKQVQKIWGLLCCLDYLSNDQKLIKQRAQLFLDLVDFTSSCCSVATSTFLNFQIGATT